MRIYIGYKYTNVEDKQGLIQKLLGLAASFERAGHQTFILGRDIQNWKGSLPLWKTFPAIIGNMLKSDAFVAYVTSQVPSRGLEVEKALSSALGKKRLVVSEIPEIGENIVKVEAAAGIQNTANVILARLK